MTLISGKVWNFGGLENFEFNFKGKSCLVIGDTGLGKTSLLTAIKSSIMIGDWPSNPITTGKEKGGIEFVHNLNGMLYTVTRTFTNKKGETTRFKVVDEKGVKYESLENLLHGLFGKAFTNLYFDYNEFFINSKTTVTRTAYLVKSIGSDEVFDNLKEITTLKKERGKLGSRIEDLTAIIDNSDLNPVTLEDDIIMYAEERLNKEAIEKRDAKLLTRKVITNLNNQLEVVKECNDAYDLSEENLTGINTEIAELEEKLRLLLEEKTTVLQWQIDNPADVTRQKELESEIATADEDNKLIEEEALHIYDQAITEINEHNNRRLRFQSVVLSYDELLESNELWDTKDNRIKELKKLNKEIFTKKLPIPGMTIEEEDDKLVVMYDGREFCYENLSKGKSLRLAMEIQKLLNPKGNNLIIIPEAQSLGSDLDDILAECKDQNIQAIVEVTERKQKFQVKFEEDYLT